MPGEALQPLTEEELAGLDARYSPFPAFADWPGEVPLLDEWTRSCDEFQEESERADDAEIAKAREIAMRAAAFDTGAIEGLYSTNRGLTFTVAEQAAAWEQEVDAQGPDARALFEAQLRAFELVLDHVTGQVPEISQAWIRRIHEELTSAQETYLVHTPVGSQEQPLPRGQYKTHPNHVRLSDGGVHAYAPVEQTQSEMHRLLSELESAEFMDAHPIIQASYAHYALVAIHPFADGNGRVARALASVYTYRTASSPLLILNEHREEYFAALAEADRGSAAPFVTFIASVAREGLELVRDSLRTAQAPEPEAVLEKFAQLNRIDEKSKERNQVGLDVVRRVRDLFGQQINDLNTSGSVELSVQQLGKTGAKPPPGFRVIGKGGPSSIRVNFRSKGLAPVQVARRIDAFVSDDPLSPGRIRLQVAQSPGEQVMLKVSEVRGSVAAIAQHRLENFVRRVVGEGLEALRLKAIAEKR